MSVLRLLSPSRPKGESPFGSHSHDAAQVVLGTKAPPDKLSLELHLPTFGSIFMKPPDDPLWPHARSDGPRDDQLLSGILEIHVPRNGQRRCKSVRVGVRTKSRLNMGGSRGWEEDTIFERKVEMMGGNADGILLDEGIQRFEFTLIIPSTFSPHDWHHNGKVHQELFAELEGIPELEPTSALHMFGLGRRRNSRQPSLTSSKRGSFSNAGSGSHSPSPTASPRGGTPLTLSPMLTAAASLSITRQEELSFPLVPSYEQSQAEASGSSTPNASSRSGSGKEGDDWIIGVHETVKAIMVMHNPNPTGGFSDLDMRQSGFAPGIGVWDLKIFSDVFSIGGPIHARLTLPSLDPKTTIFSWRLLLRQTHTLTSPRDDPETTKPVSSTRHFDIIERGTRPGQGVRHPGLGHPAVWRGKESGGEDDGECMISGTSYMPKDDRGRPTTLPGLITPINVSHMLVYEVYFSVWGQDNMGLLMDIPGPGGLRFLQVTKPLILPSCALIPPLLDLPVYSKSPPNLDDPCPNCGEQQSGPTLCHSCPSTVTPHPRHDGTCDECRKRRALAWYSGHWGWKLCACGLDAGDIAGRMKAFATEGIRAPEGEVEARWREQKAQEERGRRRVREC